jgi:hypothetical protein
MSADEIDASAFWLYPDWDGPLKEPFWMRPLKYPVPKVASTGRYSSLAIVGNYIGPFDGWRIENCHFE